MIPRRFLGNTNLHTNLVLGAIEPTRASSTPPHRVFRGGDTKRRRPRHRRFDRCHSKMAGRPASAAEVGRGASLRAVSNRYSRKEAEGAGAPPGYVSIQRADLYASSIEGSTWRMLGSVSAGQYVDNFYPDVSLSDTGLTDVAVEPARRRSNSRLRGQQAKRALETKGSQALEGPPATEVERRARARDGPRLSKNAQEVNIYQVSWCCWTKGRQGGSERQGGSKGRRRNTGWEQRKTGWGAGKT